MKEKPLKLTRTATYMKATWPKSGFDGYIERPLKRSQATGAWVLEPSMISHGGGGPPDPEKIAKQIVDSNGNILFFLDNSFFDEETSLRIWDALFSLRDSVVVIPEVSRELAPWLDRHSDHPAAKAITGKARAIKFLGTDRNCPVTAAVFDYYICLLGQRKRLFLLLDKQFENRNGRSPNADEKRDIRQQTLELGYGPRGHLFGKKGEADQGKDNLLTDEALVTAAVVAGVERERSTLILTKDEDIVDQHYKLLWLMDTQYRGMLLAERFAEQPDQFDSRPLETPDRGLAMAFESKDCTLIHTTPAMARELPPVIRAVPLHCCVVGRTYHGHTFAAHKGLRELLTIKGKTGGLNTARLGGKNCHFWLGPLPVAREYRNCAVIARDLRADDQFGGLPILDLYQVMLSAERYLHVTSPIE